MFTATKAARKTPADFDGQKQKYLEKIHSLIEQYQVPESMVINWDQTGW